MIYVLDTNSISDLIAGLQQVTFNLNRRIRQGDTISLCQPIFYEIQRGLLWKPSGKRFAAFHTAIVPRMAWIPLTDDDWKQAAQFWADSKRKGKQLSDMDVLLATLAHRIDAIIVSSDTDFDALPVKREDWRV